MFPFVRPLNLHPPSGAPPVATGACCVAGVCSIKTQAQCTADGGVYIGDNTTCGAGTCLE